MQPTDLWLDDVSVLDLSRLLPGPFCTLLLADMGADVLKIEDTSRGDYARYYPPMVGDQSAFFAAINRNKRSATLNLKDERGVEIFRDLVADADVLVESFRPGVMERLGLDYPSMTRVNEGLIYCSISGYGQDGPMAERAGHDLNYMARAGLLEQNARPDAKPVVPGFQLADIAGGALYAGMGILGALHKRTRSGQGAHVDISMCEGALSFHLPVLAAAAAGQPQPRGEGMLTGGRACYGVYQTSDGRYLAVSPLEPKFWSRFVRAIDAPDLADQAMATHEAGAAARSRVAEVIARKTLKQWMKVFEAVDVCVEPVRSPAEVLEDQLFEARQTFFNLAGVRHTRTPVTPDRRAHRQAPGHGEHTDDVLDALGYEAQDIARLRQAGVV